MRSGNFANYKLLDRLEGAPVGELYKAFNYDTKDVLSVLILPKELSELREDELDSALRDLRATADAKLAHHGLVHVLRVGCSQGSYYVEQEFVKGKPLARHVQEKGALSPRAASRVLRCIAEALHQAHSKGVIHHAVSPKSILMLQDEEAKIDHFGMARFFGGLRKALGRKAHELVSQDAIPEEVYLAPEQREGFPGDERSDIYGLGATLYFMLKGERPRALDQLPAAGAAAPLYELVRRMTSPDPKERIPSCEAVLTALAQLEKSGFSDRPERQAAPAAEAMPSAAAPAERPSEVGGDPSNTLLWDTRQLEALRAKWQEKKPAAEPQPQAKPPVEEAPEEEVEKAELAGVEEGYQPAFQPLFIPGEGLPAGEKRPILERQAQMALARRRANVQLIFGVALNVVLFLIALKLALPLIERYKTGGEPAPPTEASPREYGKPVPQSPLPGARPIPIPRETDTTQEGTAPPKSDSPASPSEPKAAPRSVPSTPSLQQPKSAEPDKSKPSESKQPTKRKPALNESRSGPAPEKEASARGGPASGGGENEAKAGTPEKDPMKADFMKDEPFSYYQDPEWAKKGKTTVRIVIPDWHKKKSDASDEEPKPPDEHNVKPDKPKPVLE